MRDYEHVMPDDVKEFRDAYGVDRTREDVEALIDAHDGHRTLLHKARMWGWDDTEVRESVYVLLSPADRDAWS